MSHRESPSPVPPVLCLLLVGATALAARGRAAPQGVPQSPSHAAPARTAPTIPPQEELGFLTYEQIVDALDLPAAQLLSFDFGSSAAAGGDVFTAPIGSFPGVGGSYLVLSTGNTSSATLPNSNPDTSTELPGLNTSEGEDLVQFVLVLDPPPGATCVAFDFAFYSEEFPEYVGSEFNDAFVAEIGQSTFQIVGNQVIAPNNFAFDTAGNVISVNTVFGVNAGNAAGTTYDGATPFLTAVSPIEDPLQNVTIVLSIMDLGDSIYDSTALVDNVRWFFGLECQPGADADSDGDALLDSWETEGIDFDNDGTVDLDLPAMGSDPFHKDVFVEVDYMVLEGTDGHTHRPKSEALAIVIEAFAGAPVANPDGTTGIRIHVDAGPDTVMNPVTGEIWGSRSRSDALPHQTHLGAVVAGKYDWTAFDAIKGVGVPGSFPIQRGDVFHYCVFAHHLHSGAGISSGVSRAIPGSDSIVSLGGWTNDVGSANEQAGTLIHELGHNFGLLHGGFDSNAFKPNYLSVMSYSFQMLGLRFDGGDGLYDYSRFLLPDVVESMLDEPAGLAGVPGTDGYGTRRYCLGDAHPSAVDSINAPIDWNCDGDATDVQLGVDLDGSVLLTTIVSAEDWSRIRYDGGAVGHYGEGIVQPTQTELDELDERFPADFRVEVGGPGAVTLQACEDRTYTITIANSGTLGDVLAITKSATQPWAVLSSIPGSLTLGPGGSATFAVPVSLPEGTPNGTVDRLVVYAESTTNPLMKDMVEVTTTAASIDTDGDGLTDFCDACPTSDLGATVVIDGCDSLVPNTLFPDGCTMIDLILALDVPGETHGDFVRQVSSLTREWAQAGLITGAQRGAIVSCAANSSY